MPRCGEYDEVWPDKWGPCVLQEHDGPHLVEIVTGGQPPEKSIAQMVEERRPVQTLLEWQEKALGELKNGSVLAGGVGSGKTFTSLCYYVLYVCGGLLDRSEPPKHPKKLIVITTAKKRDILDWEEEAVHLGIFREPELSYTGTEFIVDSWNNMGKYVDETDAFFIFDEQRLVGAGTWVKTFLKIVKNNQWILLTATPADVWMDYVPLFIAHGFYRNRTAFVDEHVVWRIIGGRYRKIAGYYGVKKLRRLRDSILVEMPFDRHTTRHLIAVETEYDKEAFDRVWKRRWNIYENRPLIDSGEMHRVARELVNTDPSRLREVRSLLLKHPKIVIFYNFDYELEILRELWDQVEVREWNGHKHEALPTSDHWVYLVQYTAGSEGWNCVETDTELYYSLTYSHKAFEQSQGRIDRLDTPFVDLNYYILMSQSKIDQLIWKSLLLKKNFHEGRKVKYGQSQSG
jgi:hypothetical protein